MNLVALLKYMQENYGEQKSNYSFKENKLAKKFKEEAKTALSASVGDGYKISASVGQGRWATIPWIAVYDKDISISVMRGFNLVYLFTNDYQGVYLSLNQGYKYVDKNYSNTNLVLKRVGDFWRENLSLVVNTNEFT
ncbi:DUF3578 domain-containing protein, partial [Listeria seeligeri]|uniref:MrcB family domain-containing protein n=1 Tax=Listeria seeligeri TaxID=1640 RepID=UPI001887ACD9